MVLCIIALVVFGIASIFSAKYRRPTMEAFGCVFRMVTLRPCISGFEEKIKSKITSKLFPLPPLAKFVYKNFRLLSWIFTIIFFASMIYSIYGIYNLVFYGSCQPGSDSCVIVDYAQYLSIFTSVLTCFEAQVVYTIIATILVLYLVVRKNIIHWK